jgi:Fe-S-cluster containining protein
LTTSNDQALFTEITRSENAIAVTEIRTQGWRPALSASQRRQDAMAGLIVKSVSSGIACKAGCWYCCYYKVEAHAEEVLQIADHINKTFSSEQLDGLRKQIAENVDTLGGLSEKEQLQANLKCPLLQDGNCSVYEVRPARCRTFHATDVSGCRQSWEEPHNLAIAHTLIPELFHFGDAHLSGFRKAMADSGYDTAVYELNAALDMALSDTTPRRRFDKQKKTFVGK